MEWMLTFVLIVMIMGSIFILYTNDLLSAVISYGIVGFGLVICFLLLKAPDLAIIQIVIETITLVIMIAVIIDSTKEEIHDKISLGQIIKTATVAVFGLAFIGFFVFSIQDLSKFGDHIMRMSSTYINAGVQSTGSANLVTGVLLDYRAYDTLGEATILFTAAIGVLTVLRLKGRKINKSS